MEIPQQPPVQQAPPQSKPAGTYSQNERVMSAIGYLGILCLVPLLLMHDNAFAYHHGRQGLTVLIVWVILWVGNLVPIIGPIVWVLGSVVLLILSVLGIVNALNGKMWEMPILGKYAKQIKV